MIKLEIKKLHKSKLILFTILFAIIMSFYVNYRSNNILELSHEYKVSKVPGDTILIANARKNDFHFLKNLEYITRLNEIIDNNHYSKYSELNHFMSNIDKKTFKEKYDISKKFYELDYNLLTEVSKFYKDYKLELKDKLEKKDVNYAVLEMEYLKKNDIPRNNSFLEHLSTNYARRIIYNSKIIFGIPFLVFAILIFYGILSKEMEDGTINLLKTQPIDYRKLVISKLISMNLISIIYLSSFFIFFALICFVQGINLGGFREIYRIFYDGVDPRYFKAYELILLILLSFTIIMNLIYSIIILINSIFRSKYSSLAFLISIFGLGYTFTENIKSLKTVFNPIYAMDHVRSIKGKINCVVEKNGLGTYQNINHSSLIYLLIFFIISVFLIFVAAKLSEFDFKVYEKEKQININKYSVFKFEVRKIVNNQSFVIYLLATLILIFSLHFFEVTEVLNGINFNLKPKGKLELYKHHLLLEEKKLKNLNGDMAESIQFNIEKYKKIINNYNNLIDGYNKNDSKKFYKAQSFQDKLEYDMRGMGGKIKKTPLTIYENILLNNVSVDNNVKPIVKQYFIFSHYQKFKSNFEETLDRKNAKYLTNSGIYTTYRMLKYQDLDIIFLGIIMFMIINGYVSEKENGSQLNMIYTQPLNRFKYNITKVFSQIYVLSIFCFVVFAFAILNGVITEGFGEIKQPVIQYLTYFKKFNIPEERLNAIKTFTTMPIWQYLTKTFIVMIMQGFLISSIATLFSIYTKSKNLLIAMTSGFILTGVILTNLLNVNIVKLYSPFSYLFANKVADNSVMIRNVIIGGNFVTSIFVLTLWGIIFMIIGSMIVNKRKQKV
ncbi:ABC transporter permease [Helcococcus ovis]|uniref:ABC transporter permease n=1 Tax=Helcococcus ovis TaxID=72026 RepID=UPI0038BB8833